MDVYACLGVQQKSQAKLKTSPKTFSQSFTREGLNLDQGPATASSKQVFHMRMRRMQSSTKWGGVKGWGRRTWAMGQQLYTLRPGYESGKRRRATKHLEHVLVCDLHQLVGLMLDSTWDLLD